SLLKYRVISRFSDHSRSLAGSRTYILTTSPDAVSVPLPSIVYIPSPSVVSNQASAGSTSLPSVRACPSSHFADHSIPPGAVGYSLLMPNLSFGDNRSAVGGTVEGKFLRMPAVSTRANVSTIAAIMTKMSRLRVFCDCSNDSKDRFMRLPLLPLSLASPIVNFFISFSLSVHALLYYTCVCA